jgi:hypothetical protein
VSRAGAAGFNPVEVRVSRDFLLGAVVLAVVLLGLLALGVIH